MPICKQLGFYSIMQTPSIFRAGAAQNVFFCFFLMLFCVVVVAHNPKLRVVNVDTVFWLEDRGSLGKVSLTLLR